MVSSMVKKAVSVPIPSSISYFWNFGSLLGFNLVVQIVSGVLLAFNYEASASSSFDSVVHIMSDVENGWLLRFLHANGASFFFVLMYCHIARGMYYSSFKSKHVWVIGVTILLVSMATAFLGYVLPWGQMSLWGATVITNLLSAIPYVGADMTVWLWGGFSVGTPTLTRFFSFHFVLPFVIFALVLLHLLALHEKGSNNPLGLSEQSDKVSFHPYFTYKDAMGVLVFVSCLLGVVFVCPDLFMDPDNSSLANPMVTPPHIQPEWYFLFAYAILRSIPSKLGGVIGLVASITIMYLCVFKSGSSSARCLVLNKTLVTFIFIDFALLTWVGAMPAAYPLVDLGKVLSAAYFIGVMIWLSI